MRDAIEIFEFAEHGRRWTETLIGLAHRLNAALQWAGAAFETVDFRRVG